MGLEDVPCGGLLRETGTAWTPGQSPNHFQSNMRTSGIAYRVQLFAAAMVICWVSNLTSALLGGACVSSELFHAGQTEPERCLTLFLMLLLWGSALHGGLTTSLLVSRCLFVVVMVCFWWGGVVGRRKVLGNCLSSWHLFSDLPFFLCNLACLEMKTHLLKAF